MKTLFLLTALGELAMLLALYLAGRKHVLAGIKNPYAGPARLDREPRAAMIVPVTGDTPAVRRGLESLLTQDYPNLRYVLVTREESDPATPLIREMIAGREDAQLALSGPSLRCGQKNHNLLAGVAAMCDWAEVYVFCDSTHVARPDLARLLLEPLSKGQAVISGGFHRIVPLDGAVPTLGMLNVCLVLHSLQPIRAITQPWGGAMAVTREAFEEHGVANIWAENIVDDFSLGPHLAKRKIRTWPVAEACLDTPLKQVPYSLWEDWLTRQLLYLKFCTPEMWLGAIVVALLFAMPPVLAFGSLVSYLAGTVDSWGLWGPVLYVTGFFCVGLLYRTFSPRPVGIVDWSLGFFLSPLMTFWCYLRTWTTFTMRWRGIAYKVTWGGRVVEVLRQ